MSTFIRSLILCMTMFCFQFAQAQSVVKGTIADQETDLPLPGANVTVPNTEAGTVTDINGNFELSVPAGATQLTVTILGYEKQTVAVPEAGSPLRILLTPATSTLNEVVIEGFASDRRLLQSTSAVGVLTEKDLQRNNNIFLQNSLNTIPGVRMNMRSGTSQSNILIRGVGTYSRFSIRGIKMYLNGIPLSDADGTTSIDDIDNTMIGRAEVIKGPASSIYGATLGGVVLFQTQKAAYGTRSINQSVMAGSYGLFRTNTGISVGTNKTNLLLNYGHQEQQGYRNHANTKKDFVTVAGDFHLNSRQTLTALFNFARLNDNYAGELDSAKVAKDPTQANPNYILKDVGVNQTQIRLGVGHTYHFSSQLSNTTSVFTSSTNLESPIEPSFGTANRNKYGARSVFSYTPVIAGLQTRFHAGSEFIYNDNLTKRYAWSKKNLDSVLTSDTEVRASQLNIFAQAEADVTRKTTVTVGMSYNVVNYQIIDRFNNHNGKTNFSGRMEFKPVFTPRAAIVHTFNDKVSVYGNVSTGFTPPTSDQISLADGSVNTALKAETNVSYELGTRGNLLKNRLSYGLSLFSMTLNNLLVPTVLPSKYTIYSNAAKSRNNGVELNVSYALVNDSNGFLKLVRPFATYSYNDFTFRNYTKAGVDYSGKKVTGVFPNIVTAGLDVQLKLGIYLNATYYYNDKMPLQDNNLISYKAYSLLNLRAGIRGLLLRRFQYDLFGGIENATDTRYSASLALNGGPSFYNPALPRNYYGGLSLKFLF